GTLTIPAGAVAKVLGRADLGPGTYSVVSAETFVALPAGATFKANGAVTVSLTSSASSASQATLILPGSAAGLAYKGTGSVSLASGDITLPQGTPPNTDPNVNFPGLSNDWNFYTFRYWPNANPNRASPVC